MSNLNFDRITYLWEYYVWAVGRWMAEHPWLLALSLVGFFVLAWLLDSFSNKRARNKARKEIAAELKTLEEYRAAAGRLVYQKPFTDDAAAIQAIDQVRDFDVQLLQEFYDANAPIAETVRARRALKIDVPGFRAMKKDIFDLFRVYTNKDDKLMVQMLGHEANDLYSERQGKVLAAHAARHMISEAHIMNALSAYIDAGKVITEVSPRSSSPAASAP
ncbi:hypothetical protein ACQKGL_29720 [Ensifer adhaerens]|uniref:hypothetical protein n=1 Tax=Ensifer adhaerens TaxID=106592 RepID=UPI003CFFB01E